MYRYEKVGDNEYVVIDNELQEEVCVINDYEGREISPLCTATMIVAALNKYMEENSDE